jgi:hypothetical protein
VTTAEDRTRAAMDAITSPIDSAPPLLLPATAPDGRRRPRPGPRARPARLPRSAIAPAAAAAIIVALAIALVIVRDIPNGRPVPVPAAGGVPRYYVSVVYLPRSSPGLVIKDTLTGARLATIAPPHGRMFAHVTGAADDRTFVAETMPAAHSFNPAQPVTWYLLRISPGGTPAYRLTRLALPDMRSWSIQGIALSASGRDLAMALIPAPTELPPKRVLRIYSVATGRLLRGWSTNDFAVFGPVYNDSSSRPELPLWWTDGDRAVAFPAAGFNSRTGFYQERLLDVMTRTGDLIADSRIIWSAPPAGPTGDSCGVPDATSPLPMSLLVTADGKTVVCTDRSPFLTNDQVPVRNTIRWLAYSVAAKTVHTRYQVRFDALIGVVMGGVLWADPSGDTIIITWSTAPDSTHLGVVSRGKFTPLPSMPAAAIGAPAW